MRTSIQLAAEVAPWPELVTYVVEAERLGLDMVFVAESWGCDAVTPIGFLAARTERIRFGTGILQTGTRTPAAIAMTALTLDTITDGRFILGLGSSGPKVIEGLHGVPFGKPLTRMRETIELVRQACAGQPLELHGSTVDVPLGGSGRPMRINQHPRPDLPIYVAALMPGMLELTGAMAQGWLGTSFVPEGADAYFQPLAKGAASAGRTLADLDICQAAEIAFGDDVEQMVAARKPGLAFSLGGMGTATTNFYNSAYARQGFDDVASRVQALWTAGRRDEAAGLIPDEMVLATTLIGTEDMVADRLRAWAATGVTNVRMYPAGDTLDDKLVTLGRAVELIHRLFPDDPVVEHRPRTSAGPATWGAPRRGA
ncbi:MAG TPA: LLM class F420-dependent oxidoreductase [Mycobacteriales bacterium]|jgi:F420-dependent oxidoreductase-like protein|nr:LLM class F420-dependent oxidoreductase [Mycobacteriales bacterium]